MEKDARGKAAEAIDRRARQRAAAAAAQAELTPEAIAAEEERQRVNAKLLSGEALEPSPPLPVDNGSADLSAKLAEAVQPIVDEQGEEDVPEPVAIGRAVIQWVLVNDEETEGDYELALQVQVDEQAPGGVVLGITQEMLERWGKGAGLQGNRVEHKKFAAGLVEKTIELAALETGNALIYALETLMIEDPNE